ncbi:phosphocarrier protein [Desulfacinum hydrothermale DSM 13146]|uniref:Phosphocarrier protein n=1 Tax=Desulfacinum hydrothermale DSM 13146 TaxID=1121390 RepID=A0A1W1XW99_9BACT|nr:HPr family phosphocarrier protein [Desulfacinum hydrothermale]SMC27821.1 phosphocarrier protein [Desulfacinum hydrothermale DSM 13146]
MGWMALADQVAEIEQEFIVTNQLGFHARVAAQIVKTASRFRSDIWLIKDETTVNGKSILDVLSLQCPKGATVKVLTRGEDAEDALKAVAELFQNKFGES